MISSNTFRLPMPFWPVFVISVAFLAGCSTSHFRASADKETYRIIQDKTPQVPNMDPVFTIDQGETPNLEDLPQITERDEAMGEAADAELNSRIISLEKALDLAVKHNRAYQNQKESLYLAALGLTLDRHAYTPIFSGNVGGAYNRSTTDRNELTTFAAMAQAAPQIVQDIGRLTGTPADLLNRYATLVNEAVSVTGAGDPHTVIVDERSVTGQSGLGVDILLKGGARIAVDLTTNFLRYLTGDPRIDNSSALVASITQPLLRGAGSKVAAERLTQAERDVLYALRDYTQYRKQFTVEIASSYYGVLQARDLVLNNYAGYLAFREAAKRDRTLVEEGRKRKSDLGRIEQEELNSENAWKNSVRNYKRSLDSFKIQLGLPTDAPMVLDQNELAGLKEAGIRDWEITPEDAIEVALVSRLDLYNSRDMTEDAARKLNVAENSLLPDADLLVTGRTESKDDNRFQELDFTRARLSAGLDVQLPLDRKTERNAYRAALIAMERSKREEDLAVDNVKLDVRNAWRTIEQAKTTYEIRKLGVKINEDRVEEQRLLAELGRGDALNLVDAQNDLTAARNDLTAALVSHTIARLEFWRAMGILFIKESGQWEEVADDIKP